ncbi:MAG: sarcosine oxidase subunit gamma family protein [Pseudomonadota bacterium]
MVDATLTSPLAHLSLAAFPSDGNETDTTLVARHRVGFFHVMARQAGALETAHKLGDARAPGRAAVCEHGIVLPTAPGEWAVLCDGAEAELKLAALRQTLDGLAYVSDQSHGRMSLRLRGASARGLMQKECAIDLHPSKFYEGSCATTTMAGIGVLVHQISDAPCYDLYCYSGYADSFWNWFVEAGEELGLKVYREE